MGGEVSAGGQPSRQNQKPEPHASVLDAHRLTLFSETRETNGRSTAQRQTKALSKGLAKWRSLSRPFWE
jgi:hypothetical protein